MTIPPERVREFPERVIVGIRPEDLDGPVSDEQNALIVHVTVKEQLGHALLVHGDCGGQQIVASLDPHRSVSIDSVVHLSVNLETLHLFDFESEETLI